MLRWPIPFLLRLRDLRRYATVGWLAVWFLIALAVSVIGNASLGTAAEATAVVYLLGYVVGALLVEPRADRTTLALGVVRLVAGLLLTTVSFLLCLVFSLPWF